MNQRLSMGWRSFGRRILGALGLDGATYREVARDPEALQQAIAVILLTSLVSAIVFLIDGEAPSLSVDVDWGSYPVTRESNLAAAIAGGIIDASWGLVIWAAQVGIIWFLWTRLGGGTQRKDGWKAIASPLGFANAPLLIFGFLQLVPAIGEALGVVGLFWTLAASIVAVRESLLTGWGRAVLYIAASVLILLPLSITISVLG